ncbi:basic helix-loop-helix (bHLH) DNA-binding superfamily protein [Abeliophyllum distichum]|uniref:Basic helix-loop-helix (BHLH) DNA-binding superfamily protein n=1 Tax=Abeliophyllum distichum TaxID=126358 RepID=A0ABD1UQ62_9LAMI
MFTIQQSNELVFPVEDDKILEELLADHVLLSGSGTNSTKKDTKKRQRISSVSVQENKDGNSNEINNKKVVHREIEKQRRQEMTKLCASLRSLLPIEYLKGKRSVSNHMNEAVNYIKHIQTSIEELSMRRDELKNSCNSSSIEVSLSRVLVELLERGLNVVSCETTKVNDKLLHRIQIQASDLTAGIDLSVLQENLTNMINRG